MYEHYQGLIFDMDGTLLDTEMSHVRAWQQVLAKYNMSYDQKVMTKYNGTPTLSFAKILLEAHQSSLDPNILVAEKSTLVEQFIFDDVKILPLIAVVKDNYGKKPMAVGTGSSRQLAEKLLTHLNIRHYFDAVVGQEDVQYHKPAPDTFLRCAQLINIAPQHCLVFEDADFGIQAAQAAKMNYIDVRTL